MLQRPLLGPQVLRGEASQATQVGVLAVGGRDAVGRREEVMASLGGEDEQTEE